MTSPPSAFQEWVHQQLHAAAHRLKHALATAEPEPPLLLHGPAGAPQGPTLQQRHAAGTPGTAATTTLGRPAAQAALPGVAAAPRASPREDRLQHAAAVPCEGTPQQQQEQQLQTEHDESMQEAEAAEGQGPGDRQQEPMQEQMEEATTRIPQQGSGQQQAEAAGAGAARFANAASMPLGLTLAQFRRGIQPSLAPDQAAGPTPPEWPSLLARQPQQHTALDAACSAASSAAAERLRRGRWCRWYKLQRSFASVQELIAAAQPQAAGAVFGAGSCAGTWSVPEYLGPCQLGSEASLRGALRPGGNAAAAGGWPQDAVRLSRRMLGATLDMASTATFAAAAASHGASWPVNIACPSCSAATACADPPADGAGGPSHLFGPADVALSEEVLEAWAALAAPRQQQGRPGWALPLRVSSRPAGADGGQPFGGLGSSSGAGERGEQAAGSRCVQVGPLLFDAAARGWRWWRDGCLASLQRQVAAGAGSVAQASADGQQQSGAEAQQQQPETGDGDKDARVRHELWHIAGLQVRVCRDRLRSCSTAPAADAAPAVLPSVTQPSGSTSASSSQAGCSGSFFHISPAQSLPAPQAGGHSSTKHAPAPPPSSPAGFRSLTGAGDLAAWWLACMLPPQGATAAGAAGEGREAHGPGRPAVLGGSANGGQDGLSTLLDVQVDTQSCKVLGVQTLDARAAWMLAGERGFQFCEACDAVAALLLLLSRLAPGDYVLVHAAGADCGVAVWAGCSGGQWEAASPSAARAVGHEHLLDLQQCL